MIIGEDKHWAGTESSLHTAISGEARIMAKISAGPDMPVETEAPPRLLSVTDGIGTITIKGPLVNSDSPWLEMFGMTGYPEIRDAVMAAANDLSVSHILLDIDSGGGSVSGMFDTGQLIRAVNDKVKPVTAFADSTMASAAYALGCSAGELFSGKAAMVGSIGVIATFKEYSKANEMGGITATIIRAGKEKALANQNEPLTAAGKAQIQAQVDATYGLFVDHVAEMRGTTYAIADKKMADGQEFIGKAAVDVGLSDGITTFDAVVGDLKSKIVAYKENLMHNRGKGGSNQVGQTLTNLTGESGMGRKALTQQDVAALAAGVALAAGTGAVVEPVVIEPVVEQVAAGAPVVEPAAEVLPTEPVVAAKVDEPSATVQLLNSQLQGKDELLLAAGIKAAKLEEQLADAQATHAPLLEIAIKSLNNMQIALGGSALKYEGTSATAILGEHKAMSEQFQAKYPVGGVAAVTGDTPTKQPIVDPRHLARVNAARFTPVTK